MSRITFDQLIPIYKNSTLQPDGSWLVTIADSSILNTIAFILEDDGALDDSGIHIEDHNNDIKIGACLTARISNPRVGLGLRTENLENVIAIDKYRLHEPERWYITKERFAYNDQATPNDVQKYRLALRIVKSIAEIAAFVDQTHAEATFFGASRLKIPINYKLIDLATLTSSDVDELEHFVFDKIHKDQRNAILCTAIIELCRNLPDGERFSYLVRHLRRLIGEAQEGYKLFASEFSYDKIRNKTEEAINDYTNKIHKTFHDVQNQILGIPLATVIVAAQFKNTSACSTEFWANLTIALGATLFALFLSLAILNQLMTLASIKEDLDRQKHKLQERYAPVAEQFIPVGFHAELSRLGR